MREEPLRFNLPVLPPRVTVQPQDGRQPPSVSLVSICWTQFQSSISHLAQVKEMWILVPHQTQIKNVPIVTRLLMTICPAMAGLSL